MSENEKRVAEVIATATEKDYLMQTTHLQNVAHANMIVQIIKAGVKQSTEKVQDTALDIIRKIRATGDFGGMKNYYYQNLLELTRAGSDDGAVALASTFPDDHRMCIPQLAQTILDNPQLLDEVYGIVA